MKDNLDKDVLIILDDFKQEIPHLKLIMGPRGAEEFNTLTNLAELLVSLVDKLTPHDIYLVNICIQLVGEVGKVPIIHTYFWALGYPAFMVTLMKMEEPEVGTGREYAYRLVWGEEEEETFLTADVLGVIYAVKDKIFKLVPKKSKVFKQAEPTEP